MLSKLSSALRRTLFLLGPVWLTTGILSPPVAAAAENLFEEQVVPVLLTRCIECHHPGNRSGGLDLTRRESLLQGGDSGPVVVPGKPQDSYLLDRIRAGEMPPPVRGVAQRLPESEQLAIRNWIAGGSAWPADRMLELYERTTSVRAGRDWWSLQPLSTSGPPRSTQSHPIDAFLNETRRKHGVQAADRADSRTRLRRLFITTLGLNPTREQLDDFAADHRPDAWSRQVDQALASPHYGERWARHWLDLVRFAETSGYERDQEKTHAWRYRDWVVRSLNDDKPFDRFLHEQLAGDELPNRSLETVLGTGFLRLGTWNDEPNDPDEYRYERLEDLVHATSTTFLGLTVKCARCHDHKFDPIPQQDYYRIAGVFWAGPVASRDRQLLGGPSVEELGFDVLGWTDLGSSPRPLHLLIKGEPKRPGPPVEPGYLSLLPKLDQPMVPPDPGQSTTGRRRQLASWMTHPDNPLTPRVIVNRIWQHCFGEGLVRTPNNFGFRGSPPTHPELLDWLARELRRSGWSLKHVQRLILTSDAFQQASNHREYDRLVSIDPDNSWLWHAERRRVDAETMRDGMLQAAGQLDQRMYGPSFRPSISPEALEGLSRKGSAWTASPLEQQHRRSLYIYSQRSLLVPFMTAFDFADTITPCGQRSSTTVPTQALALMNNEFVHRTSRALACRLIAEARSQGSSDLNALIRQCFAFCYGREPEPGEQRAARTFLDRQIERFEDLQQAETASPPLAGVDTSGLVLDLDADHGVLRDSEGRVQNWSDSRGRPSENAGSAARSAFQEDPERRAVPGEDRWNGHATIHFDGQNDFYSVGTDLLKNPGYTIVAVASDRAEGRHRNLVSNWSGRDGNSVTSIFLGATGSDQIRFSDDFSASGFSVNPGDPFVLAAVSDGTDAVIALNGRVLGRKGRPLSTRNLTGNYVIGQQGNIDGEYWHGEIARVLVFNRALDANELERLQRSLMQHYGLGPREPEPRQLALEALSQVLLNSNEFLYVD